MIHFVQWRSLFRRKRFEADMAAEFAFHMETRTQDLMRSGFSKEEASRKARMEFGAGPRYSDECRESHRLSWFDELARNVRFGLRGLRNNPGFSTAAILSLALGIGANTVVFGVMHSLLLRPLPIKDPKQVVFVETDQRVSHSFPDYKEFRDQNSTFNGMAGYRISPMSLVVSGNASRVWGYLASGNYFDVLGVEPVLGRFFHQGDDVRVGGSPYAVLSYNSWQARFGGDRSIAGRTVRINGLSYTVLGVAPSGFHGTELFYWPELWVPMTMEPLIEAGNPWLDNRYERNTWIVGRLKAGVPRREASDDLNRIAKELARQFPDIDSGVRIKLSQPGLAGSAMRGPVEAFTFAVLLLAALVLLTACANLAGLMLARAADRQRETAIRLSIGAGRGRLMLQALTESMLLAAAGGLAGCVLAVVLSRLLTQWRAPLDFPVQFDVRPDWPVFAFAALVSIATGLLFGLFPALKLSRADVNSVLKGGVAMPVLKNRYSFAFRDVLLIAEIALCFLLVFASLLAVRGLQRALTMPIGMDPENVSTAAFDLGLAGYTETQGKVFQKRVLESVKAIPGVISAAYANSLPLSIDESNKSVSGSDEAAVRSRDTIGANYYDISPGLLSTIGVPLLQGRDFDERDDTHAPLVAIVNETFARIVMRTAKPVGKTFRMGFKGPLIQVIGLVRDGKYVSLTESPDPAMFLPIAQEYNPTTTFVVRSRTPAAEMVREVRRKIFALDPRLPIYGTGSLTQMLGFALFPMHAAAVALGAFGVLAIILAITGIHGLVAYAVARRTRELGIRIALGAQPSAVLWLVMQKLALILAIGLTIGAALAIVAGPPLRAVIYGVSPRDLPAFVTVVIDTRFRGGAILLAAGCPSLANRSEYNVAIRVSPGALFGRFEHARGGRFGCTLVSTKVMSFQLTRPERLKF